jgi:hypothetical protein
MKKTTAFALISAFLLSLTAFAQEKPEEKPYPMTKQRECMLQMQDLLCKIYQHLTEGSNDEAFEAYEKLKELYRDIELGRITDKKYKEKMSDAWKVAQEKVLPKLEEIRKKKHKEKAEEKPAHKPEKSAKIKEILELCRDLEADQPGKNYFAAGKKLAKIPSKELIPGLRVALKDGQLRDKVLGFISEYFSYFAEEFKAFLPDMVDIAKNRKGRPRLHAVSIMWDIGDKRVVPILIEYCLDDNASITIGSIPDQPRTYHIVWIIGDILNDWTGGAIGEIKPPRLGLHRPESANKVRAQIRKWWTENKEEFLKQLEKDQEKKVYEGQEYYPLETGMAWTYRSGGAEALVNISRVEKFKGHDCFVVETISGVKLQQRRWLYITDEGIYVAKDLYKEKKKTVEVEYDPPFPVAKFPFRQGQKWKWVGKNAAGRTISFTAEVKGEKTVTVPAGTFTGLEVVTLRNVGGYVQKISEVLAPGVGLVYLEKEIIKVRGGKDKQTLELVKYTKPEAGKKKEKPSEEKEEKKEEKRDK